MRLLRRRAAMLLPFLVVIAAAAPQLMPRTEVAYEGAPINERVYLLRGESFKLRCTSDYPRLQWRFIPSYIASSGRAVSDVMQVNGSYGVLTGACATWLAPIDY